MDDSGMNGFLITIRSQPKHGLLYAAAKQRGSLKLLACELGVSYISLVHWVNLRGYPKSIFSGGYLDRRTRIEHGLMEVIGVGADDCWPKEVREFIDKTRSLKSLVFEQTKEVPFPRLTDVAAKALTYEPTQERTANINEARQAILKELKTLSCREREIIKLRYGFYDGCNYTLEEVGYIFKVSRERIRGIEAKAIRKLQMPCRSERLVGFVD
jgi:RNA polymerase sigma factor (sigma-70 family)